MHKKIAFFLGTFEDWGGASRALLNFVRGIDRNRFRPLVVLTREGTLSKKLTTEGIDWIIWEKHDRSKNLFSYAFHILCAYRMLKAQGIDLVHLNFGAIGWKPAEILAARLAGIPLINHLHITTQNLRELYDIFAGMGFQVYDAPDVETDEKARDEMRSALAA